MGNDTNVWISAIERAYIQKRVTGYCPIIPCRERECDYTIPEWADHPSWITGLEALEHFHWWVATVVLPIAFEWIEEEQNYKEVYDLVEKRSGGTQNHDDVGVVIAAAFELIQRKGLEGYKKSLKRIEEMRKEKPEGFDSSKINPIWTQITRNVRAITADIFRAHHDTLDGTTGYEKPRPEEPRPE